MLWKGRRESSNIEDRRGMGGGRIGGGGLGLGGIVILLIIAWALGINPLTLLSGGDLGPGDYSEQDQQASTGAPSSPQEEELKHFVSVVLADTEDTWKDLLPQVGAQYRNPKLVLFSGGAQSACGFAQSAVGPFYCPG